MFFLLPSKDLLLCPFMTSLSSYLYIWKFGGLEEDRYAHYAQRNDLISFQVFTVSIMLISLGFLIVDLTRPVDYFWVFVFRFGLALFYGALLVLLHFWKFSPRNIQAILVAQIIVTYVIYFLQAFFAKMLFFFLPNVLLLFFYTAFTISGLRFRFALVINVLVFAVFVLITETIVDEYYRSQYPNLVANLIISIISGGFIEKQKRKGFVQFSELLRQKEELDESNQQKNRVISILSHDVSAPLRSINGLLTTYEKSQITKEELDRFLPEVKVRLDKVSFLVHSLVRWSRSQIKGFSAQKVAVDIESLLRENITLVNPFVKEKLIVVHVDCPPGLQAHADYEMVNLIIRNLVSNAVKFTPKGKNIWLKAFRNHKKISIEVSNEGEPIPESVREKLFTFQIKSGQGTANESGTGLGLAMSQQFADLNEGKIYLDERTGSVNTFRVELPVL